MPHPASWSPKDPDETVNYQLPWADQLEVGDTIATSDWPAETVEGVTLEANSVADDNLSTYARVSGGVDGTTATLINRITTTNGETLEQLVTLPIVATDQATLGEYEMPRAVDLAARYPTFHDVPYTTITVHLTDASASVDTTWRAADYPLAIMALAAHNMAVLGIGEMNEAQSHIRNGVSSIRDGNFSVSFNDKCALDNLSGKLSSTPYGRIYLNLLRRNKGGPRLAGGGAAYGGWGPLAQQNDGTILPWSPY